MNTECSTKGPGLRGQFISLAPARVLALVLALAATKSASAADIFLQPVSANAPHTIVGNEIILHSSGATITFEFHLAGWWPEMLRTAQAAVESTGYTSGSSGSLAPLTTPNAAAGAFITTIRPDYIHYGLPNLASTDLSSLDYKFASTTLSGEGVSDTGAQRYLGTLIVVASPDAFGTFTIPMIEVDSFLENEDQVKNRIEPLFLHSALVTIQPRIYVKEDATGADNGSSWADAFRYLQDALAVATPGTEIWLAAGTYQPDLGEQYSPGDPTVSFSLLNGVSLLGGFAGTETNADQRDPAANLTYLSGDLMRNDTPGFGNRTDNSRRVVLASGTDLSAVMDGLIIEGGNGDANNSVGGGAILVDIDDAATIRNCTFQDNSAHHGGAAHVRGPAVFTYCRFDGNQAVGGGVPQGGAILVNAPAQFTHCVFESNTAMEGGAVFTDTVSGNTFANCVFVGNQSGTDGGAISWAAKNGFIINSVFSNNITSLRGGAIFLSTPGETAEIVGCTFSGNGSDPGPGTGGGIYDASGGDPTSVRNSILWGNMANSGTVEEQQFDGNVAVTSSLVQGLSVLTDGNINSDPLFVDPNGADDIFGTLDDDLRLTLSSPAIDAGSRSAVPADVADLDGDGNTAELLPLDLDGNPRIRNIPTVVDTGSGGLPVVDMGAYEVQPAFVDCNNNGVPDDLDILAGTSLDIDGNGVPDECAVFDNGCTPVPDWSCPDNWDLGGVYPDNDVNTYAVFLSGEETDVCLDVDVEVNSLNVDEGASLDMSGQGDCLGNLQLAQPEGLSINNDATLNLGSGQTISEPEPPSGAGMTLNDGGAVLVQDSSITLTGDVVVQSGGSYAPLPPTETNTASLTAGSVLIQNDPTGDAPPGVIELTGDMSLTVADDLTMDGSYAEEPCPDGRGGPAARSFHTPPSLIIINQASVDIGGDLTMISSAQLEYSSSEPITIAGDFANLCSTPECVDFSTGAGVELTGPGQAQFFEAAARDEGAIGDVFLAEFALSSLSIASGATVRFVDEFDNDQSGQGPCTEAVYIDSFVAGPNSLIYLQDVRVYYGSISIDPTATVNLEGCGEFKNVQCNPSQPVAVPTGDLVKPRFISIVPGNPGVPMAIRVTLMSLHHPNPPYTGGPSNPFTAFEGQVRWVGPPMVYVESNASGTPFYASSLVCAPHYQDWGSIGLLHVTGSAITPSSRYVVQTVAEACGAGAEEYFSSTLEVSTARWGDVEVPFNPPDPTVQPNASDIGALVNKFRGSLGAPIKARALLTGSDQFGNINIAPDYSFSHIAACVDAFRGLGYPFTIAPCP